MDTAVNGQAALEYLAQQRPGLILTDMRMPVMDGWELMEQIRARKLDIPVVVMSAAVDAKATAEEIHASGHLTKPFSIRELVDTVIRFNGPPSPKN
ncbi:MAG: response regulator [Dehalococcoidia bacterium]|nr:response regulator [Dehalococcoidia bacterium]